MSNRRAHLKQQARDLELLEEIESFYKRTKNGGMRLSFDGSHQRIPAKLQAGISELLLTWILEQRNEIGVDEPERQ